MQTFESPKPAANAQTRRVAPTALHIVCFSTYVSEQTQQTTRHHDVRNFLLALRGEKIEGESVIPVGGEHRALSNLNANDSIDWFGEMVVHYLEGCKIRPPFGLVPVPTPQTTLESSAGPWTSLLAISIASNGMEDATVLDVLRWKVAIKPDQQRALTISELYENLTVLHPLPTDVPLILVDYLFTSSATLRACASRLRRSGSQTTLGLCAGRTATSATHDPFTPVTGAIEPYDPGH